MFTINAFIKTGNVDISNVCLKENEKKVFFWKGEKKEIDKLLVNLVE